MKQHGMVGRAPGRAFLLVVVALPSLLSGCVAVRYGRAWARAGESHAETLVVTGAAFRLERESDRGAVAFAGTVDVRGDTWTFVVRAWRADDGTWRPLDPPLSAAYRGRVFANGVAFYAPVPGTAWPLEVAFLVVPSDFDLLR